MALIDDIRNAQRDAGERVVMEDLARKGLLVEPKDKEKLNAEFGGVGKPPLVVEEKLAARVIELEQQVVSRFDEDRLPTFRQGHPNHELESAVTAEECTWMVKEIDTLRNALMLAYGHLWHTNNEPMAPTQMRSAEKAAYEARKVLREMLTHEQRGTAINRVQEMLNNESAPSSPLTEDDMDSRFQSGRATDEQDTARLDWVLPIITGEDDAITNNRTIALAGCLAHGRNGRETIDFARKVAD